MHLRFHMQRILLLVFILAVGSGVTACRNDYTSRMDSVLGALDVGNTDAAFQEIDALVDRGVKNKKPERNHLTLLLLERGMIHLAKGDKEKAAQDFNDADQMLEILDLTPQGARKAAAAMFSGTKTVYHAPIYEKLMVNIVGTATYLSTNNISGAGVEARRLLVLIDYFKDAGYPDHPALSLAYAMAGYALDLNGETSLARKLYDSAIQIDGSPFAKQAKQMLMDRTTSSGQYAAVIVLSGHGPQRVPEFFPIGVLLGWLTPNFSLSGPELDIVAGLSANDILSVVRFPVMDAREPSFTSWRAATSNGGTTNLPLASNTTEFAVKMWQEMRPAIAMNAISRWLTREVVGTAANVAGNVADNAGGGIVGSLIKLGGLAAKGGMLAADTPDTRAWNTIPGLLFAGFVPVQPGAQTMTFRGSGPKGSTRIDVPVNIRSGKPNFILVYSPY